MTPDVSAVIVAFRAQHFLPSCLAALRASTAAHPVELIVVDNASGDGAPDVVRDLWPDARVIENRENRGFAAAANQGAALATAPSILFLNPDARPEPGCLDALTFALREAAGKALVSPRLVSPDGRAQPDAWPEMSLGTLLFDALLLRNLAPDGGRRGLEPEGDAAEDVAYLSGACLLLPRALFERLGGFDERFFLYHEDWDLCRRARDAGARCLRVPRARTVHELGGSAFQDRAAFWRLYHQSRDAFVRKHFGGARRTAAMALHRLGVRLHAAASHLAGRKHEARALAAALRALREPRP
jgi:GT2 family glycosyltransferase